MLNIQMRIDWRIKAFTLIETLLTLFITTSLILLFSHQMKGSFDKVESQLFLLEFEHFYAETQRYSSSHQQKTVLVIGKREISNGQDRLVVPDSVTVPKEMALRFDSAGGNSSLSAIEFQLEEKVVRYQLYIGNGKFKKTESSS